MNNEKLEIIERELEELIEEGIVAVAGYDENGERLLYLTEKGQLEALKLENPSNEYSN